MEDFRPSWVLFPFLQLRMVFSGNTGKYPTLFEKVSDESEFRKR